MEAKRIVATGWINHGPVSLPPRPLAYGVGAILFLTAAAGAGLGWRAASRPPSGPADPNAVTAADANTLTARPLVDITPPVAAKVAADDKADSSDADSAKAADLAAQTAKAQALQAKPTGAPGDIDTIMTSASEKPLAPAKKGPDEAPPPTPVKSDVPF
jgi:hypothetical protein